MNEDLEMLCLCGNRLPEDRNVCEKCDGNYPDEESETFDSYPEDTPLFYDYYGGE